MLKLKYKRVHKLLKNNALIANSITETLYALQKIEFFLQQQLPTPVQQHVKALNISGSTLVLAVDTPAWKSRLRFLQPEIEKKLAAHTKQTITAISIKLIPEAMPENDDRPKRRSVLSAQNRLAIRHLAEALDDSALKASLQRLARRCDK